MFVVGRGWPKASGRKQSAHPAVAYGTLVRLSGAPKGEWRLHKPEPMQPGALSAQVALGVIAEPATRRV